MVQFFVIPKTVNVDNTTIDLNASDEIQIKGGAVNRDLLDNNIKIVVGDILLDTTSLLANQIITFTSNKYKRIEIFGIKTNSGGLALNLNSLTSNYHTYSKKLSGTYGSNSEGGTLVRLDISTSSLYPAPFEFKMATQGGFIGYSGNGLNIADGYINVVMGYNDTAGQNYINNIKNLYAFTGKIIIIGYEN